MKRKVCFTLISGLLIALAGCTTHHKKTYGKKELEPGLKAAKTALEEAVSLEANRNHPPGTRIGDWNGPLIRERPPALKDRSGENKLLTELVAFRRPAKSLLVEVDPMAKLRQGLALEFLAAAPSESVIKAVQKLLRNGQLWEPWRGALVLGISKKAVYYEDILAVLDQNPLGFAGGQAALALGLLGQPKAAPRLEGFIRARYGTREFNLGVKALIILGRQGDMQRVAVDKAVDSLFTNHPAGTRIDDGISWQENDPGRIALIKAAATHIREALRQ